MVVSDEPRSLSKDARRVMPGLGDAAGNGGSPLRAGVGGMRTKVGPSIQGQAVTAHCEGLYVKTERREESLAIKTCNKDWLVNQERCLFT